MLKGIYSAAAGMTSQMIQQDIVADNLANVNTPGYKPSSVQVKSFRDSLINRLSKGDKETLGTYSKGAEVQDSVISFIQGDVVQTGNPLDLALNGDGFFTLKSKDGNDTLYTRAGSFTVDNQRLLTAEDGSHVMGVDGEITIPQKASEIKIDENGNVMADNRRVGKLKLSQFEDNSVLQKMGSNTYIATEAPKAVAKDIRINQGYMERSATNPISELVNSMTGLRIYEALQKSIQMQNETLGQAIREVGRPTP